VSESSSAARKSAAILDSAESDVETAVDWLPGTS